MSSDLAAVLTSARLDVRVSQALVADWLGVSRPTLIASEKGRRGPKAAELSRLASLYRVRPDHLLGVGESVEVTLPETPGLSDRDRRDVAALWGAAMRAASPEEERLSLGTEKGGLLPAICAHTRSSLGLEEPPFDLWSGLVARRVAVQVTHLESAAGVLLTDRYNHLLIVSLKLREDLLVKTLGHLVGHVVLENCPGQPDGTQEALSRTLLGPYVHVDPFGPTRGIHNKEGDRFASELLLPAVMVAEATKDWADGDPEPLLRAQAQRFGVSYQMMLSRFCELGLILDGYMRLMLRNPVDGGESGRGESFDSAVLPTLVQRLEDSGQLAVGWRVDFDLATGPAHLRQIQGAALAEYVAQTPLLERSSTVRQIYETTASWLAEAHPWA